MSDTPHPLVELTKTRIREFVREPGAIFWVFGFPILMAIGLGLAFRDREPELPAVAVIAAGHADLAGSLLSSNRVRAQLLERKAAQRALARAKVDVIVDFDAANAPAVIFDPAQAAAPYAKLVVKDVLERAQGRKDRVPLEEKAHTEPGSRYIDFLIPGLIGLNLMGSSMWGVGYNLVVARKRRLLRRYAVTPMRRTHFLLSYFFSRSSFLFVELTVLVLFGRFVFGTVVQGDLLSLLLVSFLGAGSFAAISLIVGARVENTESANGWMNFVQLPMWLLSGAFFSYERFPEWLHEPIRLLPLTALVDSLRAVFNDAASTLDCLHEVLVLASWAVAGFLVALKTFRWQ